MKMNMSSMKQNLDDVIKYSQELPLDITMDGTQEILDNWAKNKKWIMDLLGGELIYEHPEEITFDLPEATRDAKVNDFCDWLDYDLHLKDLADFVFENRKYFYDNIVRYDYHYNGVKIQHGSKLIRSFKYFIEDKDLLCEIQNKASMIVQKTKVTGKLCLSIHPLDYLSSSENNYNWHSCHALDGEYRTGNLSYMQDNCTIVCYLKGADNVKLPHFPTSVPWNDKKWRMLINFGPDSKLLFAGRQYPFFSMDALDKVLRCLLPKLQVNSNTFDLKWYHDVVQNIPYDGEIKALTENHYFVEGFIHPISTLIEDEPSKRHYNDLLYSTVYIPYYLCKWDCCYTPKLPIIHVGHKCNCVVCGEEESLCSETMLCFECEVAFRNSELEEIATCPCCGSRFLSEAGIYSELEDELICPNCAN